MQPVTMSSRLLLLLQRHHRLRVIQPLPVAPLRQTASSRLCCCIIIGGGSTTTTTVAIGSRRTVTTQTGHKVQRSPPVPLVLPARNITTSTTNENDTTSTVPLPPKQSQQQEEQGKKKRGIRWLMWFGIVLMGVLVIDNVLQYQLEQEAQAKTRQLAKEEEEFRQTLQQEWQDKPALFLVKAIIKYQMGGTMGLRNVTVGDVLQVLQENVGPNQGYYLCCTRNDDGEMISIGWYPTSFVEKIHEEKVITTTESRKKSRFSLLRLFY